MIQIKITIPSSLLNLNMRLNKGIHNGINQATEDITSDAINNAPLIIGTLKRSINSEVRPLGGNFTARIFQDTGIASYGPFVEGGTGLYGEKKKLIYPVKAKCLSWIGNGGVRIFAKFTKGMKGRFYMKRAFESNESKAPDTIMQHVMSALKK